MKDAIGKKKKSVRSGRWYMEITEEYPVENPPNAIQDITKALAYAGVLNGIC